MAYSNPALATRDIDVRVQILWDEDTPADVLNESKWIDETPYFISASGKLQLLPGFDHYANNKVQSQQMSVVLANHNYRYSSHVAGSWVSNYADTGGIYHKRVRVQVKIDGGAWQTLFRGHAKKITEEPKSNRVTITVFDVSEAMRGKRSTPMLRDYKEHELIAHYMTLAGLQDGVDFISPTYSASSATLDYSSSKVPYSWLDDEEIWAELGDVAQVGSARIFVNRDGMVHFWKMWRWAGDATPEILRIAQYKELSPAWDDRGFYDEIVVDYAERNPGDPKSEVWSLARAKLVNAGETEEIEAKTSTPVISYQTPIANEDYAIRTLGGSDAVSSVTIVYEWGAQLTKIKVTNLAAFPLMVSKFVLKGQPLEGRNSEQHSEKLDTPYVDRRLDVRGNPYMQSEWQAKLAAQTWAWWYREPKPLYSIKGVRGDPSRTLGSRLLVETHGMAVSGPIIDLDWTVSMTGDGGLAYAENYTILDDSRLAGVNNYFIVGETVPVSGKVLWH